MDGRGDGGVLKYPRDGWVMLMRVLCALAACVGVGFPLWVAAHGGGTWIELVLVPVLCLFLAVMGGWIVPAQTLATQSELVVRYALRAPRSVPLSSLRRFKTGLLGDFMITDTGRRIQIFHTGAEQFAEQLARRLPDLTL